jgi:hypothetical protein
MRHRSILCRQFWLIAKCSISILFDSHDWMIDRFRPFLSNSAFFETPSSLLFTMQVYDAPIAVFSVSINHRLILSCKNGIAAPLAAAARQACRRWVSTISKYQSSFRILLQSLTLSLADKWTAVINENTFFDTTVNFWYSRRLLKKTLYIRIYIYTVYSTTFTEYSNANAVSHACRSR